jgi:CRP-like cAMP-binding protein
MRSASLFSHESRVIAVRAGKPLFVAGEMSGLMYVLKQGEAKVLVDGHEVERLKIGDPVGEMSLIDHEPHSATVEAVSDCEFVCVDEKHFNFLVRETPGFALDLMRTMARRLRSMDCRL